MVNRQWVSAWAYEKGKADNVIEKLSRDGKTYFQINDYDKLHELFGQLLRETQRIKSEGDFEAVEALVEGYGVKVDQEIHAEVLKRNEQFTAAPYSGFVNPVIVPTINEAGDIERFAIDQPESFESQMLYYTENYSNLMTRLPALPVPARLLKSTPLSWQVSNIATLPRCLPTLHSFLQSCCSTQKKILRFT